MTQKTSLPMQDTPLSEVFDSVGVSIITISDTGIIQSANAATVRLFGFAEEEMVGQNVSILMPEPYKHQHDGYLDRFHKTGEKRIIGTGRNVHGTTKNGANLSLHLSVAQHRQHGKTGFTGILQDMSTLDAARSDNARFGQILDQSVNEIFVFDAKTLKFSMANHGAISNLGFSMEELQEMTPVEFKPHTEQSFRALIEPLLRRDMEVLEFETTHCRKNGTYYDANIRLHLSEAVSPLEIVAVVQDVTDKNRLVRALHRSQKMESVGNLTGGIAHDFNNILTVISGNLELLENNLSSTLDLELLNEAQEATSMGARLTHRLLSFAKKGNLVPQTVDPNEMLSGIIDLLGRTIGETILLETSLQPNLPEISVDVSQFESAVVNLAVNARDAMADGGKLLIETNSILVDDELANYLLIDPGDYVRVIVSDTGSGIDPDIAESLFEPFVTTKSGGRGTGLGLSIVYGFAEQSGGCIRVYSEPEKGSVFSLYLPIQSSSTKVLAHDPDAVSSSTVILNS